MNAKLQDNKLANNDVGIYLSNVSASGGAPEDQTNIKAVNNEITNDLCFNVSYIAAVSDVGNNDKIINNKISGYAGCPTVYNPGGLAIDASTDFTNRPKVHANEK